MEFGPPKTAGSRRTVALPPFLVAMLADHLETLPAAADTLLFTSPGRGGTRKAGEGGPVRHGLFVRRYFKPAVRTALPAEKHDLRWHDLPTRWSRWRSPRVCTTRP